MNKRIPATLFVSLNVLVAMSGCHIGPQISELPAARTPYGAVVEITVRGDENRRFRNNGELIEVGDAGFLLELERADGRYLVLVPWADIESVSATELDGFHARGVRQTEQREEIVAEFRLISRFPQGLTPALRTRLLAVYDQDAPLELIELRR